MDIHFTVWAIVETTSNINVPAGISGIGFFETFELHLVLHKLETKVELVTDSC